MVGVSKAGFGGGTGVMVAPILALVFPAKETIGMMLPWLIACDIVSMCAYWRKWDNRNVAVLMPGAFLGVVAGTFALGAVSNRFLAKTIWVLAIVFVIAQVRRDWVLNTKKTFKPRIWHGSLMGLCGGFGSALAHLGGVLTTMYLLPQGLSNERFVGTTTATYFLVNLFKVPGYAQIGVLNTEVLMRALPLLPLVLAGTALGVYLNRLLSSSAFSKVVLVIVLVTGTKLLLNC